MQLLKSEKISPILPRNYLNKIIHLCLNRGYSVSILKINQNYYFSAQDDTIEYIDKDVFISIITSDDHIILRDLKNIAS